MLSCMPVLSSGSCVLHRTMARYGLECSTRLVNVEGVPHQLPPGVLHAQVLQSEYVLDGPQHAYRGVVGRKHCAMFHIRADDQAGAAVRANVIGAILRV